MRHIVTYSVNDEESYDLIMNDKVVAKIPAGEDEAIEISRQIQRWIDQYSHTLPVIIKNDNDVPPLGIIVDVYFPDGELAETTTFWFSDFK
jgi:hypothetical protein